VARLGQAAEGARWRGPSRTHSGTPEDNLPGLCLTPRQRTTQLGHPSRSPLMGDRLGCPSWVVRCLGVRHNPGKLSSGVPEWVREGPPTPPESLMRKRAPQTRRNPQRGNARRNPSLESPEGQTRAAIPAWNPQRQPQTTLDEELRALRSSFREQFRVR